MPRFLTTEAIDAAPATVWQVLTDFSAYPEWNPMVRAVRGRAAAGTWLWLHVQPGRRVLRLPARVLALAPERELRWGGGVRGLLWVEHWVALTAEAGGTRVEHGETFDGLLAGPAVRAFGVRQAQYEAMNAALRARVEGIWAPGRPGSTTPAPPGPP